MIANPKIKSDMDPTLEKPNQDPTIKNGSRSDLINNSDFILSILMIQIV